MVALLKRYSKIAPLCQNLPRNFSALNKVAFAVPELLACPDEVRIRVMNAYGSGDTIDLDIFLDIVTFDWFLMMSEPPTWSAEGIPMSFSQVIPEFVDPIQYGTYCPSATEPGYGDSDYREACAVISYTNYRNQVTNQDINWTWGHYISLVLNSEGRNALAGKSKTAFWYMVILAQFMRMRNVFAGLVVRIPGPKRTSPVRKVYRNTFPGP